jgi:hypothetical protein
VIVTDGGILNTDEAARRVLQDLVSYARGGGTVVFSFAFSTDLDLRTLDDMWADSWQVPWRAGQYRRLTSVLRARPVGVAGQLKPRYSQQAVHLVNVAEEDRWYVPGLDEDGLEEGASAAGVGDVAAGQPDQTSIAMVQVGNGFLGYTGDVNMEVGTVLALMRMLRLS